jgi:hypothetical protein
MADIPINEVTEHNIIKKAVVVEGVGKQSGKSYLALSVEFNNGYDKLYFFDRAEQFMVEAEIDKQDK